MAFGFTRTLPTVTGSHVDMPILLTAGSFPATAIDASGDAFTNGGGNLRAYTDDTKAVRLSVDIVEFIAGATPEIQVWVKLPVAATGNTIYLEADAGTSQPAFTAAFGRNSVWTNYERVYHLEDTTSTHIDSTGTQDAVSVAVATATSQHIGKGVTSLVSEADTIADTGLVPTDGLPYTLELWLSHDGLNNFTQAVGIHQSGNRFYVGAYGGTWVFGAGTAFVDNNITPITYNQMYHCLLTRDGANTFDFYIDGQINATQNASHSGTPPAFAILGRGGSTTWGGVNDEYRISQVYKSPDAVATEYANTFDPDNWGTSSEWVASGDPSSSITADTRELITTKSNVNLVAAKIVKAETDNKSISGSSAKLTLGNKLIISGSAYSISGSSAQLTLSNRLAIDTGAYSIAGSGVNLTSNYYLPAVSASYSIAGSSVNLTVDVAQAGESLIASTASITMVQGDAGLISSYLLTQESIAFNLTSSTVCLIYNNSMIAEPGSYSSVSGSIWLINNHAIIAQSASYLTQGFNVILTLSSDATQLIGLFSVGYGGNSIGASYKPSYVAVSYKKS